MGRRVVAFFCIYIMLMLILTGWLMNVTFSERYIHAGSSQSSYTLTVYSTRGCIYDRNMNIIAGGAAEYRAVINPGTVDAENLVEYFDSGTLGGLEEKLRSGKPFTAEVEDYSLSDAEGIEIIKCVRRYGSETAAPHIIGYLDGSGRGASGIEKAYDELLENYGGSYKITCQVNALGVSMSEEKIIRDTTHNSAGGVVLTIDSQIQIAAQRAAAKYLNSGAVVILDPATGEILACASVPDYDPNCIGEYLDDENSPLMNKAFSSYDVGSVFKLAVAAAALEHGMGDFTHCCSGQVMIGNRAFGCSKRDGHGEIGLEMATALSCNTYFIMLGQALGYEVILEKAMQLGFGREILLGDNYCTGRGNLPDESELRLPAGLANFSFGQGSLMANPIQIAAMIGCIANDGVYVSPYMVSGTVNSSLETVSTRRETSSYRAIETEAARELQKYMKSVMMYGTGKSVAPQNILAAAKTGTAETGITVDGRSISRGWFAGYFPADDPQFVCVVIEEDAESGSTSAGPCFGYLAQHLAAIYGK